VRKLVYTNPLGVSVTLYQTPYLITKLEGLALPGIQSQEQKAPYQDGTTYLDALFDPRTVVVSGSISHPQALGQIFTDRATIISALNPKNGPGTLTYTNDNATYTTACHVIVATFPDKPANEPFQRFQIQFHCNDPYWYGNSAQSISMVLVTGGFTFPFTFPKTFGSYVGSVSTPAVNAGDSVTPVLISVYGPCAVPVITNQTTGQLIKCNITLQSGDVLIINTKFGSKSVTLITSAGVKSNQMATLDPTSTFWQLAIGSNNILYSDNVNSGAESCVVSWNNRYSGR
jgi:hypothetical protein